MLHLGPIFYHSEPSDVPYSPNQFLGWNFFCCFLQQTSSSSKTKIVALLLIGVFNLDRYTLNNIQTINVLASNAYNSEDLKYSSNALYLVCVHYARGFQIDNTGPQPFQSGSILKI